jgi:hypothetical protein
MYFTESMRGIVFIVRWFRACVAVTMIIHTYLYVSIMFFSLPDRVFKRIPRTCSTEIENERIKRSTEYPSVNWLVKSRENSLF